MTGPPLSISMDFIAGGLVEMIGGLASRDRAVRRTRGGRRSCSRGAWLATHWLLRESAVWRDRNTDEVRAAQRDADYAYRLAVDPPASKELRLFGLAELDDRPVRRAPHAAARAAVRGDAAAREPVLWSLLLVVRRERARVLVAGRAPRPAAAISLGEVVVFAQSAVGTSMIAFGGLSWALDGAAAPVAAVLASRAGDARRRARCRRARAPATACRRARSASAIVTFAYPRRRRRCSTTST